jgi:putative aldouronate transport system permease protein
MNYLKKELSKFGPLYIMLLPGLVLLFLMSYLPMGGILISFKNFNYSGGSFIRNFMVSPWSGFQNFDFFLKTHDAWLITRNTVLYNLTFITLGTLTALIFAIAYNELRNKRMSKIYQSVMLLPYFLSWVAVSYLLFGFLSIDKGIVNNLILQPLGLHPVEWYSQSAYWPFILIGAKLFKGAGYSSIVYLAAIIGIDHEYFEAAAIDGASKWQQIRHVTIPSLYTIMTLLILLAVGHMFFADFGLFYNLPLESGNLFPVTNVIDTYVYRALINTGDIGMSSAASTYQAVIGFILVLASNWIVRRIDKERALF